MRRDGVINVCFHGVGRPRRSLPDGEDTYWVTVDRFLSILDELVSWPVARISFDDGNSSDAEVALPALLERGLRADFFVVAGRLGDSGSLSEDDVRELLRHGMGIGTHGMSHRSWRGLDPATRRDELVTARQRLSEVAGVSIDAAACPLGEYDRRVLAELRRLGYRRVFTSDRRRVPADAWLQHRFSVRFFDTPASLRAAALTPPSLGQRALLSTVGAAKRLR